MSKFTITPDDLKRFKQMDSNNQVVRYLKYRNENNFKVGDILIKKRKRGHKDDNWIVETVSDRSPVPKKYYYAFENEFGVGYIKQIKSDGKSLCESVQSMADIDYTWTRFEVDPDFLDHVLLVGEEQEYSSGEDFNEKRKIRNRIHSQNRKIAVRVANEQEAFDFLDKMTVGQVFWSGHDLYSATQTQYTVTKIVKEPTKNALQRHYYGPKPVLSETITVSCSSISSKYSNIHTSSHSFDSYTIPTTQVFYLQKPTMYENQTI